MITRVKLKFDKFLHSTHKAFLVRVDDREIWLPKKLCWNLITNKKLGGNVVIPSFLYERLFDVAPTESEAETIVETHVPIRIEPTDATPDAGLIR